MQHSTTAQSFSEDKAERFESSSLTEVDRSLHSESAVRHFEVSFLSHDEGVIQKNTFSLDCSNTEVVMDFLPFYRDGSDIMVGLSREVKPALLFRRQIMMGDDSPWHLGSRQVERLENLPPRMFHAGGNYFPSAGGSLEVARSFFSSDPKACHGGKFFSAQAVVDSYLRGEFHDLRALLGIFRLSDELNIPLKVDLKLDRTSHAPETSLIPSRPLRSLSPSNSYSPQVASVNCREVEAPPNPFLNSYSSSRIFRTLDQAAAEHEIVVRRGIDAVDVAAYSVVDDEVWLVIKKGIRPSMPAREMLLGNKHRVFTEFEYEGIAESLEGEGSIEEIALRAIEGVREEAGVETKGAPIFLGWSYPSPERNPERAYNFLIKVDPQTPSEACCTLDERLDVCFARVEDVIAAGAKGWIKDPRLLVNAYLIRQAWGS